MEKVLEAGAWLAAHGPDVISAIMAVLSGVIGISLLIPGEQPEKSLQAVVSWLSKFSRKKPE